MLPLIQVLAADISVSNVMTDVRQELFSIKFKVVVSEAIVDQAAGCNVLAINIPVMKNPLSLSGGILQITLLIIF